ncbi:hypothetical protein AABH71_004897 [Salmonella enterica]|uniref:hypothetical protein n=1 Tax=Salmonella enterica TaxID=28901 RepID=UPI0012D63A1E|nr:hypothetical protein [Salmonella enterica]EBQ9005072.1 hypothetical protein [Salmonella enterica subsp. enterica serovar Blockley]ECU7995139.1 hypothetical protein [Salmonella enterica subsp. enterica serovar Toucra]ECW2124479.1 hypothetical protein [Salmonella enterica]
MIITGNSTRFNAGTPGNPASPAGVASAPASATPGKFYRPAGDESRWMLMVDDPRGNESWKLTKEEEPSMMNYPGGPMFATRSGGQWEVQHPLPEDFVKMGMTTRFNCSLSDASAASMEGKEILEVRLVIPDDALPPYVRVPAATPEKPYLVTGFIVKSLSGYCVVLPLDYATSKAQSPISTMPTTSATFTMVNNDIGSIYCSTYGAPYTVKLTYSRTDVNTPVNTLCIRSGATPVRTAIFTALESIVPRERISHTLTPEDDNATFYCPCGYDNCVDIVLPDIPLPKGFRVNIINESDASVGIIPKSKNVTGKRVSGFQGYMYDSVKSLYKALLTQTGDDGKTWLLIQERIENV